MHLCYHYPSPSHPHSLPLCPRLVTSPGHDRVCFTLLPVDFTPSSLTPCNVNRWHQNPFRGCLVFGLSWRSQAVPCSVLCIPVVPGHTTRIVQAIPQCIASVLMSLCSTRLSPLCSETMSNSHPLSGTRTVLSMAAQELNAH